MNPKIKNKLLDFFGKFEKKDFKRGEILLKPNKKCNEVLLLIEGNVRMFSISKKGVETTLNMFKPLSLFPLGPAINSTENLYYYEALKNVAVYVVPKDKVLTFLKQEHEVVFDLLARIFKGLDGYFLRMENLLGGNAYNKVVNEILIQLKRFGKVELTHSKLASLTGLSRETVTREILKLQKKRIVAYKGWKLKVADSKRLEQELF